MSDNGKATWRGSMYADQIFDEFGNNCTDKLSVGNCLRVECRLGAFTPVHADDIVPTEALDEIVAIFDRQKVIFEVL